MERIFAGLAGAELVVDFRSDDVVADDEALV